ncbi:beta-galactosidase/beta-glucuronidase [Vibrio variabilis]|uniref:Beta-galactosidase/beta-glucuronidase n=1 Tax=Vibrio variabilis TaxID=990271 RepID=A0ABQ0JN26_9VIBR|nr:beta-galactosidase/beta-glucuronidase [Vibrio variabilis]
MKINLDGLWQLSPLTDLSIPQDDLTFPGPLSQVLPDHLSEPSIIEQEWHLMHDFELTEQQLANPAVDLVIGGVDYYAEVRINGRAVIDCDGSETTYRKEVRAHLQEGPNRVEILFLEFDEDDLLVDMDKAPTCSLVQEKRLPMSVWVFGKCRIFSLFLTCALSMWRWSRYGTMVAAASLKSTYITKPFVPALFLPLLSSMA